jgi:protein disulfide-isomerase
MKNLRGKIAVVPMILAALIGTARADEQLSVLKAGTEVYTNVTVTSVSATDVYFIYTGGMANVKIKTLAPELQKHFHYDPKRAKDAEQKLAENKALYHQQLLRQPAVSAPDMTRRPAAAGGAAEAIWRNDYPGALQQAKAENKLVLLDFTGSDWCGWCIKFEHDVLSTSKFADYAGRKLQLVRLDFPRHSPQPDALKRANAALSEQFKVDGFPTFVLVNGDGRELGRQVGYLNGGPDAFISELEKFSR